MGSVFGEGVGSGVVEAGVDVAGVQARHRTQARIAA
jgi:hypothetical protein